MASVHIARILPSAAAVAILLALSAQLSVEGQSLDSRMECRMLPVTSCAFAVDSYGARCSLEASKADQGPTSALYSCQTSHILTKAFKEEEYIESEECVSACGVDRLTLGISTDVFFSAGFTQKLCSVECQQNCVNIVDLYNTAVAAVYEGATLARFCKDVQATQALRREMRARHLSNIPILG